MAEWWDRFTNFVETSPVLWRVILIIIVTVLINWALRVLLTRAVNQIVTGVKKSQAVDDTTEIRTSRHFNARAIQRTRTLGSIGRNVITWIMAVVALVMILSELGVNITALLASAGVVGAGLAFGAQSIVKDFLNGTFIALEDQLGVGDWITVGEISGTVEDVGLRITQIRAYDGTLWYVRNGEILTLGNSAQGWGRAIVDINIDAEADLGKVRQEVLAACEEITHNPEYRRQVMGTPELLGLESVFGDRATFRVTLLTRPSMQWSVQRELRSLLKRRFDEQGIEMATELPKGFMQ